mgnify:CR=1 FL=1
MNITFAELKENDLCFMDEDEKLYDVNTYEDFIDKIIDKLKEVKGTEEFDRYLYHILEDCKKLRVGKKQYIRIDINRILDDVRDWYYDNASSLDMDYEVYITDKAVKGLEKFVNELHEHNHVYEEGKFLGYMDLSLDVEQAIGEYFGEDL